MDRNGPNNRSGPGITGTDLTFSLFCVYKYMQIYAENSLFFHVNFKLSSGLFIIIKLLIELTVHVKFRDSGILVAGINWIITPSLIVNRCHNWQLSSTKRVYIGLPF